MRKKCRDAIERKGDEIVEKIADNLTAENVCKVLGYCQNLLTELENYINTN